MQKRAVEIAIISDVHLGTYGCHATELLNYLRSIKPGLLVINGDFIDIWAFTKRYFPVAHFEVIKEILQIISTGSRVVYITGNHDEMLRKYSDTQVGNFKITDKLLVEINGKTCWIFHGDVFDATTRGSVRVLARLGGKGYDMLILINRMINYFLKLWGKPPMSLSKRIKNSVKKAVKWISDFEETAAELAIEKKYDYVICGHIHQPQNKTITNEHGSVTYLNSGDWIENLTALEYTKGSWKIYHYNDAVFEKPIFLKQEKTVPDVTAAEVMLAIHSLAV